MPSPSQQNTRSNSNHTPLQQQTTQQNTGNNPINTDNINGSNAGITDGAWHQIFVAGSGSSARISESALVNNKDAISKDLPEDLYKTDKTTHWKPYEFRGNIDSLATLYYNLDDYPVDDFLWAIMKTAENDGNLRKDIDKKRGVAPANLNMINDFRQKINEMYGLNNLNNAAITGIFDFFIEETRKNNTNIFNLFNKDYFNTMVYEIMNCSSLDARMESFVPYGPDGMPIYTHNFHKKVQAFTKALSLVQTLAEFLENYHNIQLKIAKGCMLKIIAYMQKGKKNIAEIHTLRQQIKIANKYADYARKTYKDLNKNVTNAQKLLSAHCYNALEPVMNEDGFKHICGGLLNSMKNKRSKFTKTIEQNNIFYSRIYTLLERFKDASDDEQKMSLMQKFIDYAVVHSYVNGIAKYSPETDTQLMMKRLKESIQAQVAPINHEFIKNNNVSTNADRFKLNIFDSKKNILRIIDIVDFKDFVEKISKDCVANIESNVDKRIDKLKEFKEEQYDQIVNMYSKVMNKLPHGEKQDRYYQNMQDERDKLLKDYVLGASIDNYTEAIQKLKSQEQGLNHRVKLLQKIIENTDPNIVNLYNNNQEGKNSQEKLKISTYSRQIQEEIRLKEEIADTAKSIDIVESQVQTLKEYPVVSLRNLIKENDLGNQHNTQQELADNEMIKLVTKQPNNKDSLLKYLPNGEIMTTYDEKDMKIFDSICKKYADFYLGCTLEEFDNLNTIMNQPGVYHNNHVVTKSDKYAENLVGKKEEELDNIISEFISMSVIDAEPEQDVKPLVKCRNICSDLLDKTETVLNSVHDEFKTLDTRIEGFNTSLTPIKTIIDNNYNAAMRTFQNNGGNPQGLDNCLKLKNTAVDLKNNISILQNSSTTAKMEISKCLLKISQYRKDIQNIGTIKGLGIDVLTPLKNQLNSVNTMLTNIRNRNNALTNNVPITRADLYALRNNVNDFITDSVTKCQESHTKILNNVNEISADLTTKVSETGVNMNTINQYTLIQELKPHFLSKNKTNTSKLEDLKPSSIFPSQNEQIEKLEDLKQLFLMWIKLTRRDNKNFPSIVVIAKNNSIANQEEQDAIQYMYDKKRGPKVKVKKSHYGDKLAVQGKDIDSIIKGVVDGGNDRKKVQHQKRKIKDLKKELRDKNGKGASVPVNSGGGSGSPLITIHHVNTGIDQTK